MRSPFAVFRLTCCCLFFGLLSSMAGCQKNPHEVAHTKVTGQVLFKGKPLPGGCVNFVAVHGGFAATGAIDEEGNYEIEAPIGEVEIGVDNSMLKSSSKKPKETPHPKKPGVKEKKHDIKGTWVNLPSVFADPHASTLKYTVTEGPQTHDIKLPDPPPANPFVKKPGAIRKPGAGRATGASVPPPPPTPR